MPRFHFDSECATKNADLSTTKFPAGFEGLITTPQARQAFEKGAGYYVDDKGTRIEPPGTKPAAAPAGGKSGRRT